VNTGTVLAGALVVFIAGVTLMVGTDFDVAVLVVAFAVVVLAVVCTLRVPLLARMLSPIFISSSV